MEAATFKAIKDAIGDQTEAFELFKGEHDKKLTKLTDENAHLLERIEELESRGNMPGRTGAGGRPVEFKTYHTQRGEEIDVPSHVKVADAVPDQTSEISFERWLHAAVAGERCQDKKAVEYVREKKQLVTTTTGLQIPNEYISQWIDRLRSQMVLNACGMTTAVMLEKTQTRSALLTDPTATWHTEAGSISAANPTFAERALTAQTLVTRCQATVELSQDAPDFGAQLAAAMSRSMAAELDRAGLIGSGTPPEPLGLIGTTGIGSVTGAAITDWTKFIDAVKTLLTAGVPLDVATRNVIFNPLVWAKLENLVTGISSDKTQLAIPRAFENTNFRVTTQIPDGSPIATTAVLGDFSQLLMGIRREASVEVLKLGDYAGKLVLDFVGYLRGDFIVTRPGVVLQDHKPVVKIWPGGSNLAVSVPVSSGRPLLSHEKRRVNYPAILIWTIPTLITTQVARRISATC